MTRTLRAVTLVLIVAAPLNALELKDAVSFLAFHDRCDIHIQSVTAKLVRVREMVLQIKSQMVELEKAQLNARLGNIDDKASLKLHHQFMDAYRLQSIAEQEVRRFQEECSITPHVPATSDNKLSREMEAANEDLVSYSDELANAAIAVRHWLDSVHDLFVALLRE